MEIVQGGCREVMRFEYLYGGFRAGKTSIQVKRVKSFSHSSVIVVCSDCHLDHYVSLGIKPSQIVTSSEVQYLAKQREEK